MKKYLPSLCLNVGKSYEDQGRINEAILYYQSGTDYADNLADNPYGNMVKSGLTEGLKRVGIVRNQNPVLATMIDQWCERRDLKSLSFILPSYVNSLGSELDNGRILSALSHLSAAKCLNEEEQKLVEGLIIDLQK